MTHDETMSAEKEQRRQEIYACCEKLQHQCSIIDDVAERTETEEKKSSDSNYGNTQEVIVSSYMLTNTLVPAMRDLLQRLEEGRENDETDDDEDSDVDEEQLEAQIEKKSPIDCNENYMEAILECMAGFVAVSYLNNMDDLWKQKMTFVTCGAFEMSMHVLRQFLEDFKKPQENHESGRDKWKAAVSNDIEQMLIGVDYDAKVQGSEATQPSTTTSKIPPLVLTTLAHLTENASEELKKDRVLPLLQLVHDCMNTFLADASIQGFGCCILHNLSNPLLQELVAGGSMSIIVSSMKCHPSDPLVQEHGNAALYNLLPLILSCNSNQRMEIAPMMYREISALIPSLSAVILRGMEQNTTNLLVQQYGLLALNRICQKDNDHYEVFISEGGLKVLLNNLKMTTTKAFGTEQKDSSVMEKRDCLAQSACQFLRDLSRPTNTSMDIVRIIAVKGGVTALVHLLEHYVSEAAQGRPVTDAINIVDPAMACLRNLFCHTENIRQVMADNCDNHRVIPTVLRTMDCFQHDAAVQAYGCDCLGRLSQVDGARREITDTIVTESFQPPVSAVSKSPDAMLTVLSAMTNHRMHAGVQERAVILLWVLIVHDNKHSSSLISRLREVHNERQQQRGEMGTLDFMEFLEETRVTPKGIERLEELVDAVDLYEQGKIPVAGRHAVSPMQEKENLRTHIRSYLFKGWTKLRQGDEKNVSPRSVTDSSMNVELS